MRRPRSSRPCKSLVRPPLPTGDARVASAVAISTPDPAGGCSAGAASARRWTGWWRASRAGQSRALVLRGEAGVGKTRAAGLSWRRTRRAARIAPRGRRRVGDGARVRGPAPAVRAAARPLERLPGPQRDALGTAFGLRAGDAPDRFLVGLAVLSLLSDAAEEQPLICLVDDAQWLDRPRRRRSPSSRAGCGAESVALVFAVRELGRRAAARRPAGARRRRARRRARRGRCSRPWSPVRSTSACAIGSSPRRAATRSRCSSCRAAGRPPSWRAGSACPTAGAVGPHRGELPGAARRRCRRDAAAAAHRRGRAGRRPGAALAGGRRARHRPRRGGAGEAAGLVELGAQVRFRHPLVRSAVYGAAAPEERQRVHRALADATDPDVDPDRRAWHRAQAAAGLDEDVAAELEHSAGRAQARGGLAAAAAFLERAAELTPDPARRAQRALARRAGQAPGRRARRGAAPARDGPGGPLDELEQARAQLLHAQITFADDAWPRRSSAAARGGQAARAARRDARARDLPRRVRRGALRRPPGQRRRCARGRRGRARRRRDPPPRALRSAARRARPPHHRGLRGRRRRR